MPEEAYIKAHMEVCTAVKRKGIAINQSKRACARSHYKLQTKKGYPLDPLRSFREA